MARSDYGSKVSALTAKPSDVVCFENSSCSIATKLLTIIQQDIEGLSERISSFVTELAEIMLQNAKQGDQQLALQLVDLKTDIMFEINIFKR